MKAVILAAGVGSRLAPLTNDRPKALVPVAGRSFLFRQLDLLAAAGIPDRDVIVVAGYKREVLQAELDRGGFACPVVYNERYADWNNFHSLLAARDALTGHDFLQLDGDTILDAQLLPTILAAPGDAVLAVDCRDELDAETMKVELADDQSLPRPSGRGSETPYNNRVVAISKQLDPARCAGEYIGVTKLAATAAARVFDELARFPAEHLTHEYYEHAFHRLTRDGRLPFGIVDVHHCKVLEIDTVEDLERAEALLRDA